MESGESYKKEKYKIKNVVLCIHLEDQNNDVEYWGIVIPSELDIKRQIVT